MKNRKNIKAKKRNLLSILIFIFGLLIAIYPVISNKYYEIKTNIGINEYIDTISDMEDEEIEKRFSLAKAYNDTLDPSRLADPFTEKEKEARREYAHMLEVKEKIGYVEIPKIDQYLPIYAGTSDEILEKGVGHLEGTSLPIGGISTHSVLTAHRGLPKAKLFTDLNKMEKGDVFYIHVLNRVIAYEVDQILTVEPSDFDPILVKEGKDYSTLLTCTPYSINSHRLLVRGHRIEYTAPIKEKFIPILGNNSNYKYYLIISLIVILILVYLIYRNRKSLKRLENGDKDE